LGFGVVVWGLGCGVWGVGFGVWGLGFGVWGLGFGVTSGGEDVNPPDDIIRRSSTQACGSEAGWYLRLIDFVYHSTRGSEPPR